MQILDFYFEHKDDLENLKKFGGVLSSWYSCLTEPTGGFAGMLLAKVKDVYCESITESPQAVKSVFETAQTMYGRESLPETEELILEIGGKAPLFDIERLRQFSGNYELGEEVAYVLNAITNGVGMISDQDIQKRYGDLMLDCLERCETHEDQGLAMLLSDGVSHIAYHIMGKDWLPSLLDGGEDLTQYGEIVRDIFTTIDEYSGDLKLINEASHDLSERYRYLFDDIKEERVSKDFGHVTRVWQEAKAQYFTK